jgi:hypothetical protein
MERRQYSEREAAPPLGALARDNANAVHERDAADDAGGPVRIGPMNTPIPKKGCALVSKEVT